MLRAAALLAAGAAPLLAGSANAVEVPAVGSAVPNVGADQLITDATEHASPLDAAKAVQLPKVNAPIGAHTPAKHQVPAVQERTVPAPLPELGTLPALPNVDGLAGASHIGDLQVPKPSDLPTNTVVQDGVLSGTLPSING